ncbi:MAG TPA: DUF4328 domain-containing protein [Thermoanaerobaculia bacterium]|nr:DUF4328 domain-containing protein [Thermoanaerobaculia bacterium]
MTLSVRYGESDDMVAGQMSALVLTNALQIVAGIAVAVWVHRAYANLRFLRGSALYTPVVASAYFLIPGANLIVPHAVLRELWTGSDLTGVRTVARPPARPLNMVTLWWYLFIASVVTSNIAVAMLMQGKDGARVHDALALAGICAAAAAAVGFDVIRLVDTRQALLRGGNARTLLRRDDVAVAPEEPTVSPWRAALLPVVTALEHDLKTPLVEPAEEQVRDVEPIPVLEPPAKPKQPRSASAPTSLPVNVLFLLVFSLALLQAVITLLFALFVPHARAGGWVAATFPFGLLVYLLTGAAAIAFCIWLGRAYANLRLYVDVTPRPAFDAVHDFVRRGGEAAVLEELWAITMSATPNVSLAPVEEWKRTWRLLWIAVAAAVVVLMVSPYHAAMLAFVAMFLLWARASWFAARIAREVSARQRERIKAMAFRESPAQSQTAGTSAPPPIPQ